MMKKLGLLAAVILAAPLSYANVVELDNISAVMCQQQLTHATSVNTSTSPVVLMYMKDCPWAKKIMPLYEAVASQYPYVQFFRYEFTKASPLVAHYCFNGVMPLYSPQIYVFNTLTSFKPDVPGHVFGIEKAGLDGAATKQDIINFLFPIQAQKHALTMRQ